MGSRPPPRDDAPAGDARAPAPSETRDASRPAAWLGGAVTIVDAEDRAEAMDRPTLAGSLGLPPSSLTPTFPPSSAPPATDPEFAPGEPQTDQFDVPFSAERAALPRDRPVLLTMDGPSAGELLSLTSATTLIGRSSGCDLQIADASVGRRHARIERIDGAYVVEDLGSMNGTYIDGRRITRGLLADGHVLQLGRRAVYRFALMDAEQERVLKRLWASSTHDALTGVYNRRHADERLRAELAYAVRHRSPLAVLVLDVDHFKRVNDVHGHAIGDRVLTQVAATLMRQFRTEDLVARFGGEEFVAVLRNVDREGAAAAGERARAAVARTMVVGADVREEIPVTISIGCATLACCASPTAEALLEIADRRLYEAKRLGRNRVVAEG